MTTTKQKSTFWALLTSPRTTSLLIIVLGLLSLLALFVPQGQDAIRLAEGSNSSLLRQLYRLQCTQIFESSWIALWLSVFAIHLGARVLEMLYGTRAKKNEGPADSAPFESTIRAEEPESAAVRLRGHFRQFFGHPPITEKIDGTKVWLRFDPGYGQGIGALLLHVGIGVMMLGVGLASQPAKLAHTLSHGEFLVRDSRSGFVGTFDMVENEDFEFFQWPYRYVLRRFVPGKGGLGPAAEIERIDSKRKRRDAFWVYQNRDLEFDKRHRKGVVHIQAVALGRKPLPGRGFSSSLASLLLLGGTGLLMVAFVFGLRNRGDLWVLVDGDHIRLLGTPETSGPNRKFENAFRTWTRLAEYAVST